MQGQLFESLEEQAIAVIRAHTMGAGYMLGFSGGKDSVVLHEIATRSGVSFSPRYRVTGIDPPEVIWFMRKYYPQIQFEHPASSFWVLLKRWGLPRRFQGRWCCSHLKESHYDLPLLTGIRAEESQQRARRSWTDYHRRTKTFMVHPLFNWKSTDIWAYIRENKLPYCSLYDEGWKRIGCVGCPYERDTARSMERWPKLWAAWKRGAYAYWQQSAQSTTFEAYWSTWLRRDGKAQSEGCPLFV